MAGCDSSVPKFLVDEIKRVNKRKKNSYLSKDVRMGLQVEEALMRLDSKAFSVSNEVIFGTQPYSSVLEAKLLRILMSQFYSKKSCDERKNFVYTVQVKDLCKKLGIYRENNKHSMYFTLKNVVLGLQTKILFICDGDKWRSINWTKEAVYEKGKISITLNDLLLPYIRNLNGNFSVLPVDTVVRFRNKYGLRLYEVLYARIHRDTESRKQYYAHKKVIVEFDLDEFRLNISAYGIYNDVTHFKNKCVFPAITEITEITDMSIVSFHFEAKRKRKTDSISFTVALKQYVNNRGIKEQEQHDSGEVKVPYDIADFEMLVEEWNKKSETTMGLCKYLFTDAKDVKCFLKILDEGITVKQIADTIDAAAKAEFFKCQLGGTFGSFLKNIKRIANGDYTKIDKKWKGNRNFDVYRLSEKDREEYYLAGNADEEWFENLDFGSI